MRRPWWTTRSQGLISRQVFYVGINPGVKITMPKRWQAYLLARLIRRSVWETL